MVGSPIVGMVRIGGGVVVGGVVSGTVATVFGSVGSVVVGSSDEVVVDLVFSSPSPLNATTINSATATPITATTAPTIHRWARDHLSSGSSQPTGGSPGPPPPGPGPVYICVGSDGGSVGSSAVTPGRLRSVRVWVLRVVWLTLPLTAGAAASDALTGWDDAPKIVAAVLLWTAWGAGTLALLAPRPIGLTALRTIAPAFAALAVAAVATGDTSGVAGWGAVAATCSGFGLAMFPDFAVVAANGISYGDEQRFPLRTPPALYLGPLPFVRALVVSGAAAGPLLLADREWLWGVVALALGAPAVVLGSRALHGLARRWLVLVPAGLVVVDPMTVADSVLMTRRQIRGLQAIAAPDARSDALDLRLGGTTGNVLITLNEPIDVTRALRGRRTETQHGDAVVVAVSERRRLLAEATRRRLRVEFATEAPRTQ